ncbi:hypothetical protein IV38_GL001328 [Lactobacillus selangorensis]|uniref:Permease IIC component n=1 Tax=Lactobacillus selangorensis TaxID=81857 RepID=A0A0R2FT31_9LACO|nr:PTS sugar transporter subunit IIC [Lactobacillus selangorensis]KRN28330.1 hypothetical protein IV38_GL001328 [Lactobacillus selangorensis]KRN31832.1 hypothetical protein IV40_GL001115 [Lactobacillus selangorensis]
MNEWINNKLLPPIMKFVNTKAINALKDGMIYSIPFIIIGSIFLILANLPIPSWAAWMQSTGLTAYWNVAYNASFGVMAIFAVVGISYVWVRDDGFEPLAAGLTALVSFFLVMRPSTNVANAAGKVLITGKNMGLFGGGYIDRTWLGGQGMIAAIIIGMLTGWAYSWFLKRNITIKLPEQVPANVANSFVALIPASVIVTFWLIVYMCFDFFGHTTMTQWIYTVVQTPLQGLTDTFWGAMAIAVLVPFFWFFGVHGAVIVSGIISPLLQANAQANAAILKAHGVVNASNGGHIVTQSLLDQFGTVTGSGVTIGSVIFMVFFARSEQMRSLGKLKIAPMIFNINEPILFGMPIVMNPMLAIPFIFTPAISMGLTYFAIKFGIIPYFTGVMVPWTTPAIISGFFVGGSWKTAVWQAAMLVLTFFIYLPFARKQDSIYYAEEKANEKADTTSNDKKVTA